MISTNRNEGNRITERREIDKYTQSRPKHEAKRDKNTDKQTGKNHTIRVREIKEERQGGS